MALYKEIVSKAVLAKGKKTFIDNYIIDVEENVSTVLGCWIINHNFRGSKTGETITINGSYDVNIWYSYDNDSKTTVALKKLNYSEEVTMNLNTDVDGDTDVIIRALSNPTCTNIESNDSSISLTVSKELGIEVVGDTKVKILVHEEEDEWDIIEDKVDDKVLDKIDNEVDENFLNN